MNRVKPTVFIVTQQYSLSLHGMICACNILHQSWVEPILCLVAIAVILILVFSVTRFFNLIDFIFLDCGNGVSKNDLFN